MSKKNLAVLFSGGKDSLYSLYLAKKQNYKISCLISLVSENPYSYMFHTPAITKVKKQADALSIPIIIQKTPGKKEQELKDLEKAIKTAVKKYKIKGIITGAVESVYQASRIQTICNNLGIECFNPLWQKDQIELLEELIKNNFKIIISGFFAEPFDDKWLGKKINKDFIRQIKKLKEKYKINPAGEGGEFETFVLNCPLFKKELRIIKEKKYGKQNSWILNFDIK